MPNAFLFDQVQGCDMYLIGTILSWAQRGLLALPIIDIGTFTESVALVLMHIVTRSFAAISFAPPTSCDGAARNELRCFMRKGYMCAMINSRVFQFLGILSKS